MSTPAIVSPSSSTVPVFVDESGRRYHRFKWVARMAVILVSAYVVLLVLGFVTSLSFPIARLGQLGTLPRHVGHETLGPTRRAFVLPDLNSAGTEGAAVGSGTTLRDGTTTPTLLGGAATGFPFVVGMNAPPAATPTAVPTTLPALPPTTTPNRTTPTSRATPTSHPHGPPSTMHTRGKP